MNTILLHPTDVLFFRDGRPMSGSLSGHGNAWPLPTVTNAALHAALHRAQIKGVHGHDQIRLKDGKRASIGKDDCKFGSLLTAGPFPILTGTWLFPRPLDAGIKDSTETSFLPLAKDFDRTCGSLPEPLKFPVANTREPTKDTPKPWWNAAAWQAYINGGHHTERDSFRADSEFTDTESTCGIGIDSETGTQDGERFYSAHYLRLRPGSQMGLLASAIDKLDNDPGNTRDLIHSLFPDAGAETPIVVGGQQRICTVTRQTAAELPLPIGKTTDFPPSGDEFHVKWALLSPAIFPAIGTHDGGWLPSWISGNGEVQLLDGPGKNYARRHKVTEGRRIDATLVAAMVGKPMPVTGYALDAGLEDRKPGPKPTLLATPPGSVYYFTCRDSKAAEKLAEALNWHGSCLTPTTILNRRSTLLGEKGFGLGVCSTWDFHDGIIPGHAQA